MKRNAHVNLINFIGGIGCGSGMFLIIFITPDLRLNKLLRLVFFQYEQALAEMLLLSSP
jgi:hypothetical protein